MSEKLRLAITLIIVVLAGFGGYFTAKVDSEPEQIIIEHTPGNAGAFKEERVGGYDYINPLLDCDNYLPSQVNSVVEMEKKITAYIDKVKGNNEADYVSVYFRELNFGPWMGINEHEPFAPANLLTVPVMISALKMAESNPKFLTKKVTYTVHPETEQDAGILAKKTLTPGSSYTINELVEHMIVYSDNDAMQLVLSQIGNTYFLKVLKDIGVNMEGKGADDNAVSAKDYSGFFRLLYNATYLNRDMSEKALSILTKTTYANGIMGGVPKGIPVANKFGERGFTGSDTKQLHDCGIVYVQGSPYLICVMTRGRDFNHLSDVISHISNIVYSFVTAPK